MNTPSTESASPAFDRLVASLRAEREAAAPRSLAALNGAWHQRLAKLLRDDAADARAIAERPDTSASARAVLLERATRHVDDAERHDDLAHMAGG